MNGIVLVGVSQHSASVESLESWQLRAGNAVELLRRGPLAEWAVLHTCNRWEVVGFAPDASPESLASELFPEELSAGVYALAGREAFVQLARLAGPNHTNPDKITRR